MLLAEKTHWVVEGNTWTTHFDKDGRLTYIKIQPPNGSVGIITDYHSRAPAARGVAEQLFQIELRDAIPDPFTYDGHGYQLHNSHEYISEWLEGAPFRWNLPEDKNHINRLVLIRMIDAPASRLVSATLSYQDITDPRIGSNAPLPEWRSGIRLGVDLCLTAFVVLQIWRWRRALFILCRKPLVILVTGAMVAIVSPDIWLARKVYAYLIYSGSTIEYAVALTLMFCVAIVLIAGVFLLLASLTFHLLQENADDTKTVMQISNNQDLAIQLLSGASIGLIYLAIHAGLMSALASHGEAIWTVLWDLNGQPLHFPIGYPLLYASETLFFILITRRIVSLFTSKRSISWVFILSVWIAFQFTFPDALDHGYGSVVTAVLSASQGALILLIFERRKPILLMSSVITIMTGLVNYFVCIVLWKGNPIYLFSCILFFVMIVYSFSILLINKVKVKITG